MLTPLRVSGFVSVEDETSTNDAALPSELWDLMSSHLPFYYRQKSELCEKQIRFLGCDTYLLVYTVMKHVFFLLVFFLFVV